MKQSTTPKNDAVIFQFFELHFEEYQNDNLQADIIVFEETPYKKQHLTLSEALDEVFQTNGSCALPVVREKKGHTPSLESEEYHVDVLRRENRVTLLQLENNKHKKTINNHKETKHEHHPFCNVLIDCRGHTRLVGIERSAAYDRKPEKAAAILSAGLSQILKPHGYKVWLTPKTKKATDFWDVVNEIRKEFHDRVKQIALNFEDDENKGRKATKGGEPSPDSIIAHMQQMAQRAHSDAALSFEARDDGEVNLEAIRKDLDQLANICLEQPCYSLNVKFQHFGTYRYGANLKMELGLSQEALTHFMEGQRSLFAGNPPGGYELVEWLDRLQNLLNEYSDQSSL